MNASIKDGTKIAVEFNLYDALAGLSRKDAETLVDALACSDGVIEQVTNLILDGWTELVSHPPEESHAEPTTALGKARHRIGMAASDVARKEIERLTVLAAEAERRRDAAEKEARELRYLKHDLEMARRGF